MSKILDWIKKHVWQTVLIGFGLFFLPLILVHVAYRITALSPWFASTWKAGELITYIAGFETFLGTVALGVASVYLNVNLLNHEKKRSAYERRPEIDVTSGNAGIYSQHEIVEMEYPVFHHKSPAERGRSATKNKRVFCLYSLYLTPKKNSDLIITSTDIMLRYLTPDESYETTEYERVPDQFHYFTNHIQNNQYCIYFKLDSRIALKNRSFIGEITMNLMNTVNDYYILHIVFDLSFSLNGKDIQDTSIKIIGSEIYPDFLN